MNKKYMSDIISIDTDNMQEFYNIMEKRLKPALNMGARIAIQRELIRTHRMTQPNRKSKTHKNESWQNAAARFSLKQNK